MPARPSGAEREDRHSLSWFGTRVRQKRFHGNHAQRRLYQAASSLRVAHAREHFLRLDASEFAVMSRRLVDVINSLPERQRFTRGLRAWVGVVGVVGEYVGRIFEEVKSRPSFIVRDTIR